MNSERKAVTGSLGGVLVPILFLSLLTAGGCGLLRSKPPKVDLGDITVFVDCDANEDSAIPFEIVLVSDPALLNRLAEMPASQWFTKREELLRTFPKGIESQGHWEVVPGQRVPRIKGAEFRGKRALGVFLFADYLPKGAHRARLDTYRDGVVVRFERDNFTLSKPGAQALPVGTASACTD